MYTLFNNSIRLAWMIGVVTLVIIETATAQSAAPSSGSDTQPRHEPPPQAYQDCLGKKAGDVVQITTPREGNISATCTNSPRGLFARPERPPRDRDDPGKSQSNQNNANK